MAKGHGPRLTYVRPYIRTYVRRRTYVRTYVRAYVRTHIRTYVRTYVRAYVRTLDPTLDPVTRPTAHINDPLQEWKTAWHNPSKTEKVLISLAKASSETSGIIDVPIWDNYRLG